MKQSSNYLNFEDLNNIENTILEYTEEIKKIVPDIPSYEKKEWTVTDFPFIQEIAKIELGIERLGTYFVKELGWISYKKWLVTGNEIKEFSYTDYNRWLNNINIVKNNLGKNITLWNGQSFVDWEMTSDLEWEEY